MRQSFSGVSVAYWFEAECVIMTKVDSPVNSQDSSQSCFFFFQAEDGIRDIGVTGVQTCALPICGDLDTDEVAGVDALQPIELRHGVVVAVGVEVGEVAADQRRRRRVGDEVRQPLDRKSVV